MRLLIDTSSEYLLLAICRGNTVLASLIEQHHNKLNEMMIPLLERLLEETSSSLVDFEEIAIGMGPGSYTGTRIGVALAKSLHFALQLKTGKPRLRPFPSHFMPSIQSILAYLEETPCSQDLPANPIYLAKIPALF